MPTYDYLCRACGTTTEVIHPMVEDGPTTCELCGGALRRVIFPSGIIFKGSGFYRNDSRAAAAKAAEGSKADGSKADGSKADGSKAADGPRPSESASSDSGARTGSDAGSADAKPASPASSSDHGSSEKARPAGST